MISLSLEERAFLPGEVVNANVSWEPKKNKGPEFIVIKLLWFTEGKGEKDLQIVAEQKIEHPAPSGNQSFHLSLPNFPWSYEGKILSIKWCIEAATEKGLASQIEIVCAPQKERIRTAPQIKGPR